MIIEVFFHRRVLLIIGIILDFGSSFQNKFSKESSKYFTFFDVDFGFFPRRHKSRKRNQEKEEK